MEAEQDFVKILERLSKLKDITDTSFVEDLINRLSKTRDGDMQRFLLSKIYKEYQKIESNLPNLDDTYPVVKNRDGIEIGDISYKNQKIGRFSLSVDDLNRNVLIVGSTGHGKTSLVLKILEEAEKASIKYLVFDLKKDYQALGLLDNSVYVSGKNLRVNPLEPPAGISYKEWAVHFADVFSDSFSLLIGSRDYLLENVVGLFSKWEEDFPPSLYDLLKYLENYGKRNDYFKVVSGRINGLLTATEVFDCNNGISFERLDNRNVVISMDNLGVAEGHFLVSFVLSYFYYSAMHLKTTDQFKRVFVIDDAHSVLDVNQERDYAKGIPILHSIISKIRELGFGFIFSDQQISSVISSALQNTNTKFIGRINLLGDLPKVIPSEYNLVLELGKLEKGEFILLNDSVYPFVIFRSDMPELNKNIDTSLLGIKEEMTKDFLTYFKSERRDMNEIELLKEVSANPFSNLSRHRINLSNIMNSEDFNIIKQTLMTSGVLSELQIFMDDQKAHKFLFISGEYAGGPYAEGFKVFTENSFFKYLAKGFVSKYLKSKNIQYQEEESGFLIRGLVKTYIFIAQDIIGLLRLMETSFDKVIFIVKDNINKEDVLADLIKNGSGSSLINMRNLAIMHFLEFKKAF